MSERPTPDTAVSWRDPYDPRTAHTGVVLATEAGLAPFDNGDPMAWSDRQQWIGEGRIPVRIVYSTRYPHERRAPLPVAGTGYYVQQHLDRTVVWVPDSITLVAQPDQS